MSEEFIKETNKSEEKLDEIIPPQETIEADSSKPIAVKKSDPWKTAFIILAGIAVISAGIFYAMYGRKSDLPAAPSLVDLQALPVQMGNPPTGATELAALAQQVPQMVMGADGKLTTVPGTPGAPGGESMYYGAGDPWANPGKFSTGTQPAGSLPFPPGGVQMAPSGQSTYMETNPNSPFMQDGNMYVMVPAPNANSSANSNKAVPPSSPKGGLGALPTPPPANKSVTNPPAQTDPAAAKPDAKPADTKPAVKPAASPKKPSGKPSGTTSSAQPGTGVEKDSE
jgi:hypothetical protein